MTPDPIFRALSRWRARAHHVGEQWTTWKGQWAVERELERVVVKVMGE